MKISKEERKVIVDEFKARHNGRYDADEFLKEVKEAGESHPAYRWFTWDQGEAAYQFNLIQARMFAQHIEIYVEQPKIVEGVQVNITTEAPAFISPISNRSSGGGYVEFDVNILCEEAAKTLRSWLRRYQVCLNHVGQSSEVLEQIAKALEKGRSSQAA